MKFSHAKAIEGRAEKAVLFFAGWGTDSNSISNIGNSGYDIITIYDYSGYNEEDIERIDKLVSGYNEVNLVAWSMGVWAASAIFEGRDNLTKRIKSFIAINGTPKAIDDLYGIPEAIYNGTLSNLQSDLSKGESIVTSKNLKKFNLRMCGGKEGLTRFSERAPERTLENIVEELRMIKENYYLCTPLPWKKVIISTGDYIFPVENLKKYWKEIQTVSIEYIEAPHYPFHLYEYWGDILQ